MGLSFGKHSSCSNNKSVGSYSPSNIVVNNYIKVPRKNPNPNKYKFNIVKEEIINNKSILLVRYEGCTTFNGLKLLLLKNIWNNKKALDPHFLDEKHIVLARFEPNEIGWKLARNCAQIN